MAVAVAHPNIALVKYWGKADSERNLPAAESLSLTLGAMFTQAQVELSGGSTDALVINGVSRSDKELLRVSRFLDLIGGSNRARARVTSTTNFPMSAGLASSAAAFAALALAGSAAYGSKLDRRELSILARRGSGSAARSMLGGFVRVRIESVDGYVEAFAEQVESKLELHAAIAIVKGGEKELGSTDGMEHTRQTSPYHSQWLSTVTKDMKAAIVALGSGDFEALADVTEGNALAMHADAMAARPGILYFEPETLELVRALRALRKSGVLVTFTIDAGPNVVALAPARELPKVTEALAAILGSDRVLTSPPGEGAKLVES
ncbi:MAG: diphosphomevalonate decarboxylase [Deltaproteobacteria bacterium]|nr:diphosphomevalonate decarboxylase [Deltaproteobacteria bacterium]